jgi:hypothetical protein
MNSTSSELDEAIKAALAHELYLATERLSEFVQLSRIDQRSVRTKQVKIKCHDAYSRFLHHLYEFWLGIVRWKTPKSCWGDARKRDAVLTQEAGNAIRRKILVLRKTAPPGWEEHVRRLDGSIDSDFAKHFRLVRNRTAHALYQRACPAVNELTLGAFLVRYHYAVLCLFETAKFAWTVRDIESFDWLEIEAFDALAAVEAITVRGRSTDGTADTAGD